MRKRKKHILEMTTQCLSRAEKGDLIAHMLRVPEVFDEACARLNPSECGGLDRQSALVFQACHVLHGEKVTPRHPAFQKRLRGKLCLLRDQVDDEDDNEEYAKLLAKNGLVSASFRRNRNQFTQVDGFSLLTRFLAEIHVGGPFELLGDMAKRGEIPNAEALQHLQSKLDAIATIEAKPAKTIGDEWADHRSRLKQYRGRRLVGLKTGLEVLDRRTLGLRGLFLLAARPGAGKTTYACVQIAVGVCRHHADNDAVVLILSLDMDRYDLYRRIDCHLGQLDWGALMFAPREDEGVYDGLQLANQRMHDEEVGKRLMVLDRTAIGDELTVRRLAAIIQDLKARAKATRALLVVDYLQLLPVPEEVADRGDQAADKHRIRMIQQVIETTRTVDNPFGDGALVISEARKPTTAKEGWGESMAEIMGSARISYAGDAVLLYREMTWKEIEEHYGVIGKGPAEEERTKLRERGIAPVMVIMDKGRDGMIRGRWGMEFDYRKSVFRELNPPGRGNPSEHLEKLLEKGRNGGIADSPKLPLPAAAPTKKSMKPKKRSAS